MRVTLAQLETFHWVARLGSVTRAAIHLNLAQPTVSLRLRGLERALNMTLFERTGRILRVAQEAQALLDHAGLIMDEVDHIQELAASDARIDGTITVGVPETLALVCLPRVVEQLTREHPALRLELIVDTSSKLERQLQLRSIDMSFIVNPSADPALQLLPLGIQETCWVAATRMGLSSVVCPSDLRELPILSNSHPSPMHRQITEWFQTAGLEPRRLSICNSVTVIAQLVIEGIVISLLPSRIIETEIADGRVQVLVSRPTPERSQLYAVYRAGEGNRSIMTVVRAVRNALGAVNFLKPF